MAKAKPPTTTAKLTYEQIDSLARGIAQDLAGSETMAADMLMLLFAEIAEHPFDNSHVETIAHLIKSYLFTWTTRDSSDAEKAHIASFRRQFLASKAG